MVVVVLQRPRAVHVCVNECVEGEGERPGAPPLERKQVWAENCIKTSMKTESAAVLGGYLDGINGCGI